MRDQQVTTTARQAGFAALAAIRSSGYANLVVNEVLTRAQLSSNDARFVTELVYGTCRNQGTLDMVIEMAAGRELRTLQPAVVDVLRLGTQQLLRMRVPAHAAVSSSVGLAKEQIGHRVAGVVNAILRRVAGRDWEEWLDLLTQGLDFRQALAVRTCHPGWIVDAYAQCLPEPELAEALAANNRPPLPTLAVRPSLMTREELLAFGGEPTPYSEWGVARKGDPLEVAAVRDGRAGVQDEGSQLVAAVLARVDAPAGPWLDMCAGPGGKAALLTGLARERSEQVVAADIHPHRVRLVADALQGYPGPAPVMVADGRTPAWGACFSRVILDAPCTGLGALRRRPEARWRKTPADLTTLVALQRALLDRACQSVLPGGVVAYVTCSPHLGETAEVVAGQGGVEILDAPALLPGVRQASASSDPRFIQLWPHRHGTDAMFCALLRRLE
ncbi:MAG: rRNA cytosine-C5-methylase [Propionibacteriaceae bacterium]|nr:rRNA cytosine-C5-methylase [Propionibacteriaceae bacterium]